MTDVKSILVAKDATRIERFAAEELAAYIQLITGKRLSISNEPCILTAASICVGCLPDTIAPERIFSELSTLHNDGFIIKEIEGNIVIQGKTPRATLYGVYSYLQMLGVRWYFPGQENEFVPRKSEMFLKNIDIRESPDINHRSVVIYFHGSKLNDWIDFAAKSRLNAIHLHSDEGIDQISELMANRGLEFNIRRHFFGESYSLSAKSDLEKNKSFLLDYIGKLPEEINEFFLWPADVRLKLLDSSSEWSLIDAVLMFTNEMSKAIRTVRPGARMSFLDYWSTWGKPEKVKPLDSVFLEIAPIHRCFSHSINDLECPVNSKDIRPVIEDLAEVFDMSTSHVLEYWLDASLFGRGKYKGLDGRLPQFGEIIKEDIKYYKSREITNISTFAVGLDKGYFSRYASPSVFQYPALLWNTDYDLKPEMMDFCENYYGDRSVCEIFQLREQIDPGDASSNGWKALREKLLSSELMIKEVIQGINNDIQIARLEKLLQEYKHVSDWMNDIRPASI